MPYIESVKTAVTSYSNNKTLFTVTHTRKVSGAVESWLFLPSCPPIKAHAKGHGYNKHTHNEHYLAVDALKKAKEHDAYFKGEYTAPAIIELLQAHADAGAGHELDSTARRLGWTVL